MARPAERASGALAVTTLLLSLQLLLPVPASSQAAAGLRVIASSPIGKKIGKILVKEVISYGGTALIKRELGRSSDGVEGDQLGSAAADNAGLIVYNISAGPESFSGVVDIFNDFLWVECPTAPAISSLPCDSPTCLRVLNSTADDCDATASDGGDCEYEYGSADLGTNTTGYLANETFTVGGAAGSVVFGCSTKLPPNDETGAIGFGNGPLSILSQLGISKFSYFLTPDDSNTSESTSVVLLGDEAVPQTKRSHSTPLLQSSANPGLYYVKLTNIQVDGETPSGMPAGAFELAADGNSGGVVLSTINAVTWLQSSAYTAVRQALVSKIASEPVNTSGTQDDVFDLCYDMQSVATLKFPKITLVFDGGADSPATMDLTTVHYFYKDYDTGLQCLTMLPMEESEEDGSVGSILGSMLQAGTNMIYDVGAMQLTFEKGAAAPVPSRVSLMMMAACLLLAWVCL